MAYIQINQRGRSILYCNNCGKQLEDGAKICYFCGASQAQHPGYDGGNQNQSGYGTDQSQYQSQYQSSYGTDNSQYSYGQNQYQSGYGTDQSQNQSGYGADNSQYSYGQNQYQSGYGTDQSQYQSGYGSGPAFGGGNPGGGNPLGSGDWKSFITPRNVEMVAAVALALPLVMLVVNLVAGLLFGNLLGKIPGVGVVMKIIPWIIRIIFMAASLAALAGSVWLIMKRPEKRTVWTYVTIGFLVIAFVACLGISFGWKVIWISALVLSVVWAIDVISRVIVQKKGLEEQPSVATDLRAYEGWISDYKKKYPAEDDSQPAQVSMAPGAPYTAQPASYFDGTGINLFGLTILTGLVSAITCSIALPWMLCKVYKWRKTHTVINGRRLDFNGTGGSLLGHYILWALLTVITCGIYGFFMYVALKKWEMEHTVYADEPNVPGQFDGNTGEYILYSLLLGFICLFTLGIGAPWAITLLQKWQMGHCIVSRDRMYYDGTALGIFGQYIVIFLLSVVTCGLYSSWGIVRMNKYILRHTHVANRI